MSLLTSARKGIGKLALFLYGTKLLRPSAAIWIASMGFLAIAMGLLEGGAWFKMLESFLPADCTWIAVAVAVVWGLGIWIIDASFTTVDILAQSRTSQELRSSDAPEPRWWQNKVLTASAIRLTIVVISMAVTGQHLARTLDARTAVDDIHKHDDQARAALIETIRVEDASRQHAMQDRLDGLRDMLKLEIAGKGPTGKGGEGPMVKQMRLDIGALSTRMDADRKDTAARLQSLATMSLEDLARFEHVDIWPDNAATRARLRQLHEEAGDHLFGLPATHVLASSLFLLLFLLMLVLKIYQPRSVTHYYDDELQEGHDCFLRGGFDHLPFALLPAAQRRDGPAPMGPARFERWYRQVLPAALAQAERVQATVDQQHRLEQQRAMLIEHREALRPQGVALEARIDECQAQARRLLDDAGEADLEIARVRREFDRRHQAIDRSLADAFRVTQQRIQAEISEANANLAQVDKEITFNGSEKLLDIMSRTARLSPHMPASAATQASGEEYEQLAALQREKEDVKARQHALRKEKLRLEAVVQAAQDKMSRLVDDPACARPHDDGTGLCADLEDRAEALQQRGRDLRAEATRHQQRSDDLAAELREQRDQEDEVAKQIRAIDRVRLGLSDDGPAR